MKTKKIRNRLFLSLLSLFMLSFSACIDEDNLERDKGSVPLAMTVNSKEIVLDNNTPVSDALRFEWTSGTNQGTDAGIEYTFEMDLEEGNFEEGIKLALGRNERILVYKHEALNQLLLDEFSVSPNDEVILKARVIADVLNESVDKQTSEVVSFSVKTYTPVTKNLYLIGGAAPNGWSADEAIKMNTVSGSVGGFTWNGRLNKGELKFITTLGQFTPSYNKGIDDTKLYYRESDEDEYDEKFTIEEAGNYEIKLNVLTEVISIRKTTGPEYDELWIVGSSTGESGWGFEPMNVDVNNPYIFSYNARLSGEFKIATEPDFDDNIPYYRPAAQGVGAGVNLDVVKLSGQENADDYKWSVDDANYKIKLDIQDLKIDILEFIAYPMIYLVGEATPNGWSIDDASPMEITENEFIFTWSGYLKEGEFKFTCDKQSDWNGDWFTATADKTEPTGVIQSMVYTTGGSGKDYKWNIAESGDYTIELDQFNETVIIKKK